MQPLANITPLKPAGAIEVRNVGQIFKTTTQDVVALQDVSLATSIHGSRDGLASGS